MPTSQENKVHNTFGKAMDQINNLQKVFRDEGMLAKAVVDIGGSQNFSDIQEAFDTLYGALEDAHYDAMGHLDSHEESVEEAGMGAPDYNPAKASKQGPGYASLPQPIKLAGDSIWDRDGENPPSVTMTDYEVEERDGMIEVVVMHDGPWTVYTDSGFEEFVSDMIGMEVSFSEQGMQEDGRAHLEGSLEMESADLARIKKLAGV
jgi:hypothetical protein